MRSVDHLGLADHDPHVGDVARAGSEEDEIARLELLTVRYERPGVELFLRGSRQLDAGGGVGGLDEAGAVEAAGTVAAPEVGRAELSERVGDCAAGGRGRCADRACIARERRAVLALVDRRPS